MKSINYIVPALMALTFSACSSETRTTDERQDSTEQQYVNAAVKDTVLTTRLAGPQVVGVNGPIELTFTVYNQTDSVKTFCKWHTPFEPLLSKYLDITSSKGEEVSYMGPMAKRVMPPPADSYISVKPGDSISAKVDLREAYQLSAPGDYRIHYNSEGVSGLKVTDSLLIKVKP